MRRALPFLAFFAFSTVLVSAQSGRGRPPAPAPTPKPVPRAGAPAPAPPGVAEGGRLVRQDVDGTTTRFVLRNGLTIIFRERHAQPLAAITVYIKAGTLQESDTEAGLAQLTAQMLLSRGDLDKEILRLGGVIKTEVGYERTTFRIVAPAESLAKTLELLSSLLQNPTFGATELKKSSEEVILTNRGFEDDVPGFARDRLNTIAFSTHRLKRGRIAPEASLSAISREQVIAFYQTHYQPQNTIISIVGDVFTAKTIVPVQLLFGKWIKGTATVAPAVDEPPQDKLRYGNARGDIGRTMVTIGYRLPPLSSTPEGLKERATFEVLAAVLASGQGARLTQALREGLRLSAEAREKGELAGLVTSVSSDYQTWPGAAMLVLQLIVDPTRLDRAEAEYFREIERFKREVISEGELQRARFLLEKQFLDMQSRVEHEADLLAFYQARLNESRLIDAYLTQIGAVTAQDVQQAAAKYLTFANTSIFEYEPQSAQARTFTSDSFAETMNIFAPSLTQAVKPDEIKSAVALRVFKQGAERVGVIEGRNVIIAEAPLPVKDFSVLRGAKAFVREDRSQPKLAVGIFFQGGRLIEDQATSGLTELMLRAMLKSTMTRKSDLIALETESLGGEIRLINEPDFFGFTLDALSRNAETVTRIVVDILENPYFEKGEVIRERERLLADQAVARDRVGDRAEELMFASLYPGHPYGLPRLGLPSVVKTAAEGQLEAWYAKTIQRQLPLVIIVGDTDGSALVSRIFSDAFKRAELDKSLKVSLPNLYAEPKQEAEARGRRQTAQTIGIRTVAGQSNDVFALSILSHFIAARGRMNVSSNLDVVNDARAASGTLLATIASLPGLETKQRDALISELGKTAAAPPVGDDFDFARNAAIGSYAIRLEAHPDRALEYARAVLFGRKASDVDAQPDLVRGVKLVDLKRVAEAVLKTAQAGVGIVRGK